MGRNLGGGTVWGDEGFVKGNRGKYHYISLHKCM